jgi:hypothetical protein
MGRALLSSLSEESADEWSDRPFVNRLLSAALCREPRAKLRVPPGPVVVVVVLVEDVVLVA